MQVTTSSSSASGAAAAGSARRSGGLPDDCRVEHPKEISELLRRFVDADLPVSLSAPDGTVLSTSLWAEDRARGLLVFSADPDDQRIHRLVRCNEAVAVGYIDNVRLQFEVRGLVLVRGRDAVAINAEYPEEILRFQRRESFRVRPLEHSQPTVHVTHPATQDALMVMRVTDISLGGIALVSRAAAGVFTLGQVLPDAVLELDAQTQVSAGLRVVHVGEAHAGDGSVRLGCEILDLAGEDARTLQRYIDHTQHRRRMLSL